MVVSREAREYKEAAGWAAKAAGVRLMEGPLTISLTVYRPQRRGDLDNTIKVLLDSLNGVAWTDDDQIVEIHAVRRDDKHNPRVEVGYSQWVSLDSPGEAMSPFLAAS